MKRLLSFVLAALLTQCLSFAQEMAPVSLLSGRLTVSMPAGSRIEARSQNIMAAPEANESETRVVFEDGGRKMVLMSWELFQLAGKHFEEEVAKRLNAWGKEEKTAFTIAKAGGATWGAAAKPNDSDGDAILYAAAFFRHEDNSVQQLAVYFNPEFHRTPERCRQLAAGIMASIASGKRGLNLEGGKHSFSHLDADHRLILVLPPRWAYSTNVGVDFLVHNLREVTDFGTEPKSIGIYVGGHPGFQHEQINEAERVQKIRKSPLFGKDQSWIEYGTKTSGAPRAIETISLIPSKSGELSIHIFTSGTDEEGIGELLKIAATARIEKASTAKGAGQPASK